MSERAFNDAKTQIRSMLSEAKYPQARIYATQLLKKFGDDAELLYLRGTACAHRSAPKQAEKDLRAAITLQPGRIDYYLTLCNLLFGAGKYERAFSEYVRVKNLAPKSPKIKAFAKIFNGSSGKLNMAIVRIEAEYKATDYKAKIADKLASLYLIKAMFKWHARHQDKSLVFYATNTTQLEHAEFFLDKMRMLPVSTNIIRQKRAKLDSLITLSRRKQFDGFISDRILSVLIVIIGISGGSIVDLIYALSAVASFLAYMRPNYMSNRARKKRSDDLMGHLNVILDFAYGESIRPTNKTFSGISDEHHRVLIANVLRSLVRSTLLPMAVFAGFLKNFSAVLAVSFVTIVALVAVVFAS